MASLNTKIPSLKLNDGRSMPMIGFGTGTAMYKWPDREDISKLDPQRVEQIQTAIRLGYRHLDCAEAYNTEPELGQAIKKSGVAREELFVTTKCSRKSMQDVAGSFERSLRNLGLDYVDLYLLHAPYVPDEQAASKEDKHRVVLAAWKEAERILAAGKARSIGVSNFQVEHLELLAKEATIVPACNQIELHGYKQQKEVREYMKEKGIAAVAYGAILPVTKASPGPLDDCLAGLAKKYAVSEGDVLLRWCIDLDIVPVTTSSKEQRLSDYLRIFAFKLTPREIEDINEIGSRKQHTQYWQDIPKEG